MKKENKNSNQKDTYSSQDLKRYLGALAETHNGHLKGIKEGFSIINRKLDEHSKILDNHSKILDNHSKILDNHSKILDGHSKILNSHTEMIGSLMVGVSDLKQDMQFVKKELKRKVDYDEFLSLVQRVIRLEGKS